MWRMVGAKGQWKMPNSGGWQLPAPSASSAGAETKVYVDAGPALEKAFEAGLGFLGKNTNIITRESGSWGFLVSILANLELVPDAPHTGACGS